MPAYDAIRGEILRLADRNLDRYDFAREGARLLRRAVPFDAMAGVWFDPETGLPVDEWIDNSLAGGAGSRLPEIELDETDIAAFRQLAASGRPAASMSEATGGTLDRSRRPRGVGDELRSVNIGDSGLWCGYVIFRERGAPDFTGREVDLIASLNRGCRDLHPVRLQQDLSSVRQDCVVHGRLAALFLGDREVLEGGHPIAPPVAPVVGDRLEVARASKLLGAEAFGHHACKLRDVTLLGCLDEGSLHAELLQPGCNGSAAFRIPVDPRHVPTLCALRPRSRWVEECAASPSVRDACALHESRHRSRRADRAGTRYRVEAVRPGLLDQHPHDLGAQHGLDVDRPGSDADAVGQRVAGTIAEPRNGRNCSGSGALLAVSMDFVTSPNAADSHVSANVTNASGSSPRTSRSRRSSRRCAGC
jgi:hypothetical protein